MEIRKQTDGVVWCMDKWWSMNGYAENGVKTQASLRPNVHTHQPQLKYWSPIFVPSLPPSIAILFYHHTRPYARANANIHPISPPLVSPRKAWWIPYLLGQLRNRLRMNFGGRFPFLSQADAAWRGNGSGLKISTPLGLPHTDILGVTETLLR